MTISDGPRAASQNAESSEVKQRIFEASLNLFSRKGYSGVSIREICRAAETTAPMVYYYFGNKKGLYQEILNEASNARRKQIEKAYKTKSEPMDWLRRVLEAWAGIEDTQDLQQLRFIFLREQFGMGSDNFKRSVESYDSYLRQVFKKILEAGVEQGIFRPMRTEMVVLAIIGIVNTYTRRRSLGAPLKMEDAIELVMDTLVNGIAFRKPVSMAIAIEQR
jgi:AcrR family transcriptional regulator